MNRQRLVIDKIETVTVTRAGDPPEVQWGDRDCTSRDIEWCNLRFTALKTLKNWDTEVISDKDRALELSSLEYDGYETIFRVPWDFDGTDLYLLIATYSDGDTFGWDDGYQNIVGAFVDAGEAHLFMQKNYKQIARRYNSYFGKMESLDIISFMLGEDEI